MEASFQDGDTQSGRREGDVRRWEATQQPSWREEGGLADIFFENPKTRGSPGVFFASEEDSRSQGEDQKKKSGIDRSIPEGVRTTSLGGQTRRFLEEIVFETPQNWREPWRFFCRSRQEQLSGWVPQEKLGRDKSFSEGVKGTRLGPGRGGSRKIKFSKIPQTGGSPGDFFARQEDTSRSSPCGVPASC